MIENDAIGCELVTMTSPKERKIRLFRALFAGRADVYARRWTGRDGKSGYSPVCHRVEARQMEEFTRFRHVVRARPTPFVPKTSSVGDEGKAVFADLVAELVSNEARNRLIAEDVLVAVREGRSPVVISERREHLDVFARMLEGEIDHLIVLRGGMGVRKQRELRAELESIPADALRRLVREGVDAEAADLFVAAALARGEVPADGTGSGAARDRARSAAERFLFRYLGVLPETKGLFKLNAQLPIPFGPNPHLEVDLLCDARRLAIGIDGAFHFVDAENYRRDRRKDYLLQDAGYLVLRFLAEDVTARLESVLDVIRRALVRKIQSKGA